LKDIIYITGHKNPDTDSICSTLAYAEFKNKTERIPALAVRLGDLNRETKFVLDYFGVEAPMLIDTVKTQVSDLNFDNTAPISPEISLKMVWNLMKKYDAQTLPIINEDNNLVGIVSVSNLTSSYMDVWDNTILSKSNTKIENILDTLAAKAIYIHGNNPTFKGKIVVTSAQPSSIKEEIAEGDIAICADRIDSQEALLQGRISLMIITGNHDVTDDIIEKAKQVGCSIIITPHDSFTASRLITQSIPVSYVMSRENLISFRTDDFVDEIKDVMLETRYRSYPIVNKDNNVIGSISRYHLISQNRKKVILLDHNERSQSVDGLEDADIMEVIDHHRVADIETGHPIYFRNEPVGSTSTIIANIFFENGIRPTKKTAGLLCAAIISDTLYFKSPTSTNVDILTLKRLSEIADIDIDCFARDMFKAGTSFKGKSASEIFHQDFKIFNLSNLKVGISQAGTMDIEGFSPIKDEMLNLMEKKTLDNNFNLLIFMLTDILNEGSLLLVTGGDKELVNRAFNTKLNENSVYLPGILSRKKQIIPPLTSAITVIK
jgi:manganese-dependent inorganic pyrophosphatase